MSDLRNETQHEDEENGSKIVGMFSYRFSNVSARERHLHWLQDKDGLPR